jgi:hypothetical protein
LRFRSAGERDGSRAGNAGESVGAPVGRST